jgi:hypothetical protein
MPIAEKRTENAEGASGTVASQAPPLTQPIENDDGRQRGQWETRYPREVWQTIIVEGAYLVVVLAACVTCLFLTWIEAFSAWLDLHGAKGLSLNRYLFYLFGGVLGGVLFGMKWLYHSVARGFWNYDRKPWRYLVPVLAGGFAFASAFIIEAGLSRIPTTGREAEYVAVGFLIGYFSDKAISMLSRVADVIFGSPEKRDR